MAPAWEVVQAMQQPSCGGHLSFTNDPYRQHPQNLSIVFALNWAQMFTQFLRAKHGYGLEQAITQVPSYH